MNDVVTVGLDSPIAARAIGFDGDDVLGVMRECASMLNDGEFAESVAAARAAVDAACGELFEVGNPIGQILATASVVQSLTASMIAWLDALNLYAEIAEIEEGM